MPCLCPPPPTHRCTGKAQGEQLCKGARERRPKPMCTGVASLQDHLPLQGGGGRPGVQLFLGCQIQLTCMLPFSFLKLWEKPACRVLDHCCGPGGERCGDRQGLALSGGFLESETGLGATGYYSWELPFNLEIFRWHLHTGLYCHSKNLATMSSHRITNFKTKPRPITVAKFPHELCIPSLTQRVARWQHRTLNFFSSPFKICPSPPISLGQIQWSLTRKGNQRISSKLQAKEKRRLYLQEKWLLLPIFLGFLKSYLSIILFDEIGFYQQ